MGDAFEGIRVVELAQWVFVPVAGALLADWGADVIRVDRPEGDPYRNLATQGIGTDSGGINLSVALANRGKRSIALDLRTEAGREILHRLLDSADVLLTSLRPAALDRLGLGADEVRARHPQLVYARGHGYGVRGPDADRPGYDASAFWARGGVGHVLTPPERDHPISPRGAFGDRNGGMALAFGVAAALVRRARTGEGSVVDVSLLATAMWTLSSDVLSALQGMAPRAPEGRVVVNPLVGSYRTKDGRHIQLVFLESDRYWPDFCSLVGRADLAEDPRFADLHARGANAAGLRRRARRRVRGTHVRRVEGAPGRNRRAVGAGPGGRGAAGRPPGARQRLPGRGSPRRRCHLPPAAGPGAVRRARRPTCVELPSTASTPSRCCWSSATPGTTSLASAKAAVIP